MHTNNINHSRALAQLNTWRRDDDDDSEHHAVYMQFDTLTTQATSPPRSLDASGGGVIAVSGTWCVRQRSVELAGTLAHRHTAHMVDDTTQATPPRPLDASGSAVIAVSGTCIGGGSDSGQWNLRLVRSLTGIRHIWQTLTCGAQFAHACHGKTE